MRLLFDIGNTRIKWAIEERGRLLRSGAILHQELDMASLRNVLGLQGQLPVSVWASNVASDDVQRAVDDWVASEFALTVNWAVVDERVAGVENKYADLSQLGVDRWMAVLGAYQIMQSSGLSTGAAIIVDVGTAVTIDVLDECTCFQGGVILPGAALMRDSLVVRTAGIKSSVAWSSALIGKTTQECVNSGACYGLVGAIERIVFEMQALLKPTQPPPTLFITGGDAELVMQHSNLLKFQHTPELVLNGLCFLSEGGVL